MKHILLLFRSVTRDGVWIYIGFIDNLELQVITALLLISTLYKSPQHLLSHSPDSCVFNSHSLAMASNSGDSSASRAYVVTVPWIFCNRTLINCQLNHSAIPSQPPLQSSTELSHSRTNYFTSLNWTALSRRGVLSV
jgi:hypothetical protein